MPDPRDPVDPPTAEPDADRVDDDTAQGVRQQRGHIEDLDGEDPLRGGVAD
jgi:hypothetical protein